jgi:HD-GYP domain-containing protein (c-di-GMP phosphodiesterase class II)
MAEKELRIHLWDLITSLSKAVDLISPAVANHHMHVSYIALEMASELGLSTEEECNVAIAGALHDIGALSLTDRTDVLQFELIAPHKHAELGYRLLQSFSHLSEAANLIRYHHVHYDNGAGLTFLGEDVPVGSHILHISDRVDVLIDKQQEILGQVGSIRETISGESNGMFDPTMVMAFNNLAEKEYFWLSLVNPSLDKSVSRQVDLGSIELDINGLTDLAKLFSHIIDFRSRFTSTHSSGVSATAEILAKLSGFSERECQLMKIAGYLHDLGKLAVPPEILEKPERLTDDEFRVIKSHPFYTHNILAAINEMRNINELGSLHHERLDGGGYPFHYKDEKLSLGSKIMAVADVFVALSEDRPYRKGMKEEETMQILHKMVDDSALDENIVSLVENNKAEINKIRSDVQIKAAQEYQDFVTLPSFYEVI